MRAFPVLRWWMLTIPVSQLKDVSSHLAVHVVPDPAVIQDGHLKPTPSDKKVILIEHHFLHVPLASNPFSLTCIFISNFVYGCLSRIYLVYQLLNVFPFFSSYANKGLRIAEITRLSVTKFFNNIYISYISEKLTQARQN
jgi:hypothetical protein